MRDGNAPYPPNSEQVIIRSTGKLSQRPWELHHDPGIGRGGAVYGLSTIRVVTLSTDGPAEVACLAERLDAAYQDTAANLPKNAAVQVDGGGLVLSALDKLEEPHSLVALKAAVAARMPLVDLPELLLEMHTRTGFANGFTHASESSELRQRHREGQEEQLGSLGLVVNVIVLWNTIYMDAALNQLRAKGFDVRAEDVARLSPLGFDHINMLGRSAFILPDPIARGELRPLRNPTIMGDES